MQAHLDSESWQHFKGEATKYEVDWRVKVENQSTSVSSVIWLVDSGNATITSEALTAGLADAIVTTASEGCSVIKLTAVLADGQTDIYFFKVKALDPNCVQSTSGRY